MMVLFHYWSSTCSQKARFALSEKGLRWESRHVDLFAFEHWTEPYLSINPDGLVPTLVHDEATITDSGVILEYLEDRFPDPRLSPVDPTGRARMRTWFRDADRLGQENVIKAGHNVRIAPRYRHLDADRLREIAAQIPDPGMRAAWRDKAVHGLPPEKVEAAWLGLERLFDRMEQRLRDADWLVGEAFGNADIALAPYVERVVALDREDMVAPPARPAVAAWRARVRARPAFATAFSFRHPDETSASAPPRSG